MPVQTKDGMLILKGVCCREWPLIAMTRIGRCGICGAVPKTVGLWEESDNPKESV